MLASLMSALMSLPRACSGSPSFGDDGEPTRLAGDESWGESCGESCGLP